MKPVVKIALVAGLVYALTRKPETKEPNEIKDVFTTETPLIPVNTIPAATVPINQNDPIASTPPIGQTDTPIFNEQALPPVVPKIGDTVVVLSMTRLTSVQKHPLFNRFTSYFNAPFDLRNKWATTGETFKMVGEYLGNLVVEKNSNTFGTPVTNYFSVPFTNVKKA